MGRKIVAFWGEQYPLGAMAARVRELGGYEVGIIRDLERDVQSGPYPNGATLLEILTEDGTNNGFVESLEVVGHSTPRECGDLDTEAARSMGPLLISDSGGAFTQETVVHLTGCNTGLPDPVVDSDGALMFDETGAQLFGPCIAQVLSESTGCKVHGTRGYINGVTLAEHLYQASQDTPDAQHMQKSSCQSAIATEAGWGAGSSYVGCQDVDDDVYRKFGCRSLLDCPELRYRYTAVREHYNLEIARVPDDPRKDIYEQLIKTLKLQGKRLPPVPGPIGPDAVFRFGKKTIWLAANGTMLIDPASNVYWKSPLSKEDRMRLLGYVSPWFAPDSYPLKVQRGKDGSYLATAMDFGKAAVGRGKTKAEAGASAVSIVHRLIAAMRDAGLTPPIPTLKTNSTRT